MSFARSFAVGLVDTVAAFGRALSGAELAEFNLKHPRGPGGRFVGKLAEAIVDAITGEHEAPRTTPKAPRARPAKRHAPRITEGAPGATEAELGALSVTQLREVAKVRGVRPGSGRSKADLVHALKPPPPVPPPPPALTGWRPHWWQDVTVDTEPGRPVPVRNLEIGMAWSSVTVRSGSIYRHGGVAVLVDDDATNSFVSTDKVVREFFDQHREFRSITSRADEYQHGYAWVAQRNPSDAEWAVRYNLPDFRSAASAGSGTTIMWGRANPAFGPNSYRYTLRHEFGHHVDHGLYAQPGLSHLGSDSPAWATAARRDSAGYHLSSVVGYTPLYGLRKAELYPDPSRLFPDGVTDYGRSSPAEDFAESVELYLAEGSIGTGQLTPSEPRTLIYFRDLFPARAAILDQIFPDVAARQQNLRRTPLDRG